jgi:DNA-directed RNA polymerase subunit N (RpoN/RPB10)
MGPICAKCWPHYEPQGGIDIKIPMAHIRPMLGPIMAHGGPKLGPIMGPWGGQGLAPSWPMGGQSFGPLCAHGGSMFGPIMAHGGPLGPTKGPWGRLGPHMAHGGPKLGPILGPLGLMRICCAAILRRMLVGTQSYTSNHAR